MLRDWLSVQASRALRVPAKIAPRRPRPHSPNDLGCRAPQGIAGADGLVLRQPGPRFRGTGRKAQLPNASDQQRHPCERLDEVGQRLAASVLDFQREQMIGPRAAAVDRGHGLAHPLRVLAQPVT